MPTEPETPLRNTRDFAANALCLGIPAQFGRIRRWRSPRRPSENTTFRPVSRCRTLPGAAEAETFDLDATYFDTDDLRLARNRRTLRRRTGGSDAGWHLKTPGDGSSRTEHRLPLDGDAVPEELQTEVRAIVRREALRPVARLRTHRVETPVRDADGRTLALIAQDHVRAESDGAERTWHELEVELVDGGPEVAGGGRTPAARRRRDTGERAVEAGARAQRSAAAGRRLRGQPRVSRTPGSSGTPSRRTTRVRGRVEPESVHKMRVATRRLRSTLKTFKRSFPSELASRLRPELKWLAGQLGEVRDGQVLSQKLLGAVEGEGPEFAESPSGSATTWTPRWRAAGRPSKPI